MFKGLGSNESSNVSRWVKDPARRCLFNLRDVNCPHRMKVQESHQMHQSAGGGPHRRAADAILQQVGQVLFTFRQYGSHELGMSNPAPIENSFDYVHCGHEGASVAQPRRSPPQHSAQMTRALAMPLRFGRKAGKCISFCWPSLLQGSVDLNSRTVRHQQ